MARLIHAVDMGSSQIRAISARVQRGGELEVLAYAVIPSRSLERGLIRDINEVASDLKEVIRLLERMLGQSVKEAAFSISGYHLGFQNTKAMITVAHGDISSEDVNRVIHAAQSTITDRNVEILHTRPQGYTIDGGARIRNPIGMRGTRLDASVHLITAQPAMVQHLIRAAEAAGIYPLKIIAAPLAAAYGASSEAQRDQGVIVVDLGSGTTDICVYYKKAIVFTGCLDQGAELVTRDIANSLRIPIDVAEQIKIQYGLADPEALEEDENVEISIPGRTTRYLERSKLAALISSRYTELFKGVIHALESRRIHLDSIRDSAVLLLSGGGMGIEGVAELAEKQFELPTMVAMPYALSGSGTVDLVDSQAHNTLIGLVRVASETLSSSDEETDLQPVLQKPPSSEGRALPKRRTEVESTDTFSSKERVKHFFSWLKNRL